MPKPKQPKNEAIGECPCPARGCDRTASVYRFRARENELQRRLGGKLYLRCAQHGQFGSDGAAGMQEYILENATIWERKPAALAGDPENPPPAPPPPESKEKPPARPTPEELPQNPPPPPSPRRAPHIWEL